MVQGSARCAVCGAVAPSGSRYCASCGSSVAAPAAALPVEVLDAGGVEGREVALGGPPGRGRGRAGLVVGALAIGLVAVGLAVGSGGGSDDAVAPDASDAAPAPTTVTTATTATTRPERPPRSTRPLGPTTSSAPPEYSFAAPPDLGGTALYATTGTGDLIAVDPTGSVRLLSTDTFGTALLARQGGVVDTDGNRNVFRPDDGGPSVQLRHGAVLGPADPGLVWVQSYDEVNEAVLQRVADGAVVATVGLPGDTWAIGTDGDDLLVSVRGSGSYRIDPAGAASLLVRADVLDATELAILVHECDEALSCGNRLVDRASGEGVAVPSGATVGEEVELDPTAVHMALVDYEGSSLAVVELATGRRIELGPVDVNGWDASAWSIDGSHLFWINDGDLQMWSVGSDAPTTLYLKDGARDRHLRAIAVVS